MHDTKSRVLLLAICSNSKTRVGESPEYHATNGIAQRVPPPIARSLFDGRRRTLALVTSDAKRYDKSLRDLPYNRDLVPGPDFQLTNPARGAAYLPTALRYTGRFYSRLGEDRHALLARSPHHLLIVSGLYGLLTPEEPIQCYSCHVTDHPRGKSARRSHW